MAVTLNASTSTGYIQTADTSGDLALQSNGTTQFNVTSTGAYGQIKSGTAVASTSGTSIDFTSIPSWVKRITVMFSGVSTNGSSNYLIQLGSGSFTTSGYSSSADWGGSAVTSTAGFIFINSTGAAVHNGTATIVLVNSNTWAESGILRAPTVATGGVNSGAISLSGTLDRVRITTVNGTDTFDAGTINILYEG